jgi:[acyl-carrier-protein] S-malonyltransferase
MPSPEYSAQILTTVSSPKPKIAEDTFEEASDTLGFDLWALTQKDQEGINQTQNTQP